MVEPNIGDEFKKRLNILTAITVLLFLLVIGLGGAFFIKLGEETDRTTAALCAFRGDLQDRVSGSKEFLKHHPNSALAGQIKISLEGQKRAIKALAILSCPPSPIVPPQIPH